MRLKRHLKGCVLFLVLSGFIYLKSQIKIGKSIQSKVSSQIKTDEILATPIMVEFKIEDIQVDFSNFIFRRDDYWKDINTTK